jgi:hypothetical protein
LNRCEAVSDRPNNWKKIDFLQPESFKFEKPKPSQNRGKQFTRAVCWEMCWWMCWFLFAIFQEVRLVSRKHSQMQETAKYLIKTALNVTFVTGNWLRGWDLNRKREFF